MKLLVFILFVLRSAVLLGQTYYSKIVPFEVSNPNPIRIIVKDNFIYINSINYINNIGSSSIIRLDKDNYEPDIYNYEGFAFARNGLFLIDQNLYGYGDNNNDNEMVSFVKFDIDLSIEIQKTYNTPTGDNGVTASESLNNNIYGVSVDDSYPNGNKHREVNVKKFDTLGNELWSKNYGQSDNLTYCWEAEASKDNHILLSTGFHNGGIFSQLIKIDTLGEVVWHWRDTEECRNGGVNHNIAPMRDGNIVLTTTLNKKWDDEFIINDWYPYPPKLSWISSEGKLIKEILLTSPHYNELLIYDLQAGRGDYFFGFGQWVDPDTDEQYGWIFKMNSTGEILWNRHYQHGEFYAQDNDHIFKDLIELDNGDLLILGDITPPGKESEIWLVKLDENGCLGDDDCGDEIILAEENLPEINHNIMVYPNPASYTITFSGLLKGKYTYRILNTQGQQVLSSALQNEDIIDVSDLPSGMYFIELINEDGQRWIEKFVVGR